MASTVESLKRLVLSATELHQLTDWPAALIEDYLNILDDIIKLAEAIDDLTSKKLEEIDTDFSDGSVVFVNGGFPVEDNPDFTWDPASQILNINGTISGKNRAKQYFYTGI